MTGRLDMNVKKIINVADTIYEDGDCINYSIFQSTREAKSHRQDQSCGWKLDKECFNSP